MSIPLSMNLFVSRKDELDCLEMATYLSKCGIKTSISKNISTLPRLENGCKLTQTVYTKNEISDLWIKLKDRYNFNCAHLEIKSKYDGCILDYLRPELCKGKCNK